MKLLSAGAIRRCLIAEPGNAIFSADFDQVELRVVAALANEPAMIAAAKKGESLHKLAAVRLFGADYNPDQYKLAKNINFTFVFAGGAATMVERYEITYAQASQLMRDYTQAFPALARYKRKEQDAVLRSALADQEYRAYKSLQSKLFQFRTDTKAGRDARAAIKREMDRMCRKKVGYTLNAFGRRLIVNAEKPYAVVNYKVQSTAADLLKQALLDVADDQELGPTIRLPIHDELLGEGPIGKAEYLANRYAEVMTREFMGVPITADAKVYGGSWGHGYGAS